MGTLQKEEWNREGIDAFLSKTLQAINVTIINVTIINVTIINVTIINVTIM